MLAKFRNLEIQNDHLTEVAYGWCSMVCESYSSLENGKDLLLLALEIGFRHINLQKRGMKARLIHVESHQIMVDIVFQTQDSEAIADLLCAWTSSNYPQRPHPSLKMCAGPLISLHYLQPFSPRLQKLVIRSIELIGYQGFE